MENAGNHFPYSEEGCEGEADRQEKIFVSCDFGVYYKGISGAVRVKISRKMLYTFAFL